MVQEAVGGPEDGLPGEEQFTGGVIEQKLDEFRDAVPDLGGGEAEEAKYRENE